MIFLQTLHKYYLKNFTPKTAFKSSETFTEDFQCMKKTIKRNFLQVLSVRDELCDNKISDFEDNSRI